MANATAPTSSAPKSPAASGKPRAAKKVYSHVMSDQEKFAVSIVIQARKACGIVIDSIKSGNGATGETLRACASIATSAATLAFGENDKD